MSGQGPATNSPDAVSQSASVSRRGLLTTIGTGIFTGAGCATPRSGETGDEPSNGIPSVELGTELIGDGFTSPVNIISLNGGRFIVADQPGTLVLVEAGRTKTILDLTDRIVDVSGYSERGLLGATLHPDWMDNGRLFLRYSAPSRQDTPEGFSHTFVLSEFSFDSRAETVNPKSERTLLEIPEPQPNHNAGDIAFGPDGYLYIPVGDGGGAGDQGDGHAEDWYDPVGGGNGQDVTTNLLGSLLRIDVDSRETDRPYAIPGSNPLVGREGLDEHYAWGLRNPWRISFGPQGRCFVADVGQNQFEEVNIVENGGNYGWNVREGTACYGASHCPTVTPSGEKLRPPVIQYGHGDAAVSGVAIIGGHVYQGSRLRDLHGHYIFGDWKANGRLFIATERPDGLWRTGTLPIADDGPGPMLLTIGEDTNGELLIATTKKAGVTGSTGAIHRLVPDG